MQIQYILEDNHVIGLEVSDASHFSDFEQQLNENAHIRSFSITSSDSGLSVKECITILQHLAALKNLTALRLNVHELMCEEHNAGQALALLLSCNKLQNLDLYGDVTDSNTFFESIYSALKINTSLKHFGIYCQNFSAGIYSDIAKIINMRGSQKLKITLEGFNFAPIHTQIGFTELMDSVANVSNSVEVHVVAIKYLDHAIDAYNAIIPAQAVRKKLQKRVSENYIADLHSISPRIDNSVLALPDDLLGHIMTYITGLQAVLRIIYLECKTKPELVKQFVRDIHRVRSEILWANTVHEQVLGHHTIRTGLYFDAMRGMHSTDGSSIVDTNNLQRLETKSTQLVTYTI